MQIKNNVDEMKVGVLTIEQHLGKQPGWAGSSRIRAEWLTKGWDNAETFKQGQKYDVVIYQKAYWIEHAKQYDGIKILDLCDPDWLHWQYRIVEMIGNVDAITTSTEALANEIRKFTNKPVLCVPDRLDLEFYKERKFHEGEAKWVVWYGYSSNYELLKPVLHFLKKFNLNLIVISDKGFSLPVSIGDSIELRNLPWNIDTVNQDILEGDIVVNPMDTSRKWKYKSNNKTIAAWALGMPVAHDIEDLKRLINPDERKKESKERLVEVKEKYDIRLSIPEYKGLIEEIIKNK